MNKGFGVAKKPAAAKKKGSKAGGRKTADEVDAFPYSGSLRPGIQTPRRMVSAVFRFLDVVSQPLLLLCMSMAYLCGVLVFSMCACR